MEVPKNAIQEIQLKLVLTTWDALPPAQQAPGAARKASGVDIMILEN